MATPKALFVYGTLRSGEAQHGLVQHLSSTNAKIQGSLYQLPAGYPALKLGGQQWVYGELLASPDERLLRILDLYEGVNERLFERVEAEVLVGLVRHHVWVYVMRNPKSRGGIPIPGGRWKRAGWK